MLDRLPSVARRYQLDRAPTVLSDTVSISAAGMLGGQPEIIVGTQQRELMVDTELCKQRVDRTDLNARATTAIS